MTAPDTPPAAGSVDMVTNEDPTLNFITPRVAAGVLFTDDQDRILMVVPSYKDYLDIPGGYVENGETPYQAAQREVYEELGIKPPIGRLLVADWWEDSPENNGGPKLLLIFDGGALTPSQLSAVRVDGEEVVETSYVEPRNVGTVTIPRLANRLQSAMASRAAGQVTYLENGIDRSREA